MRAAIDHLVYGVPELTAGVARLADLLGVTAAPGGSHEGRGSHNALLSLGDGAYLEIIAPDPAQPKPPGPRPFGLDSLTEPRMVTFAVHAERSGGAEPEAAAGRLQRWRAHAVWPGDGPGPGGGGRRRAAGGRAAVCNAGVRTRGRMATPRARWLPEAAAAPTARCWSGTYASTRCCRSTGWCRS